jgi:hypothetical protein
LNALLPLINEVLVFVFDLMVNFLNAYYFLILLFTAISLVISVLFYVAKMARTHTQA